MENSPSCARVRPLISAVDSRPPTARTDTVASVTLSANRTASRGTSTPSCVITAEMSSSMPMEMKNTPLNTARKGRTSDNACNPYSDSEMIRPAMKAPMAMEKPTASVTTAVPMQKKATHSVNNSRSRNSTIRSSVRRTMNRPPIMSAVMIASPRRNSMPMALTSAVPSPASTGSTRIAGNTHKSWKSRMEMTERPCAVSSSALSE